MSQYVDGFVVPVPKEKLESYRQLASQAAQVWKEYGALEYRECVLNDPEAHGMVPFPQLAKIAPDETVVLAWIVYESRAKRDEINALVMQDPRLANACTGDVFDWKRMAYGGFETLVQA